MHAELLFLPLFHFCLSPDFSSFTSPFQLSLFHDCITGPIMSRAFLQGTSPMLYPQFCRNLMVILQLVEQSRKDPTPLVPCSLRNQNSLNCKGPFKKRSSIPTSTRSSWSQPHPTWMFPRIGQAPPFWKTCSHVLSFSLQKSCFFNLKFSSFSLKTFPLIPYIDL